MTIRADLVNETLYQMRDGKPVWPALYAALRAKDVYPKYWHALSLEAQQLLIQHIELRAKLEANVK